MIHNKWEMSKTWINDMLNSQHGRHDGGWICDTKPEEAKLSRQQAGYTDHLLIFTTSSIYPA